MAVFGLSQTGGGCGRIPRNGLFDSKKDHVQEPLLLGRRLLLVFRKDIGIDPNDV